MNLTDEEKSWLAGDAGPALRRAMEIVVALGNIYGAERLIPVESVQISGVSYRNLGAAGLDFLRRWADEGARVRVPTTLNPTAMDMQAWRDQGFSPDFAAKQQAVVDAFAQMGVGEGHPIPTCTPYLIGNCPPPGASIAWAESSAVSYANSVLGARTNREGGPGAIAAALTGRTAAYGLHRPEQRRATLHVIVETPLDAISDYSALGALVGKAAANGVPYFTGLPLESGAPLWQEKLKALGAAMAATGAVALYHVEDVTPEAPAIEIAGCYPKCVETHSETRFNGFGVTAARFNAPNNAPDASPLVIRDLAPGYALVSDPVDAVDLVWIGCPQASLAEIKGVADMLDGRRLRVPLWITCARPILEAAAAQGLTARIEAAGGRVFADACLAIAPVRDLGFHAVATPSAKGAYYLRNLAGVKARFAPLAMCVKMAEGRVRS
ncbi:MAG TPA: aconitase X catalytic domain-containing protein [Anaerolineae bacterium]|nr:aconitase X catalytic domain-containing protein [Anaerolineae bacterium]